MRYIGYLQREDRRDYMAAHFAAVALSPHTRKTIKARDIYSSPDILQKMRAEEEEEKFEQLENHFYDTCEKYGVKPITEV